MTAPSISAPVTASTIEDTALTFSAANGNAILVSDADSATLTVTLATNGLSLTLGSTAGLTFSDGANGDFFMTFSGTIAAINAALNGLVYVPYTDTPGPDVVEITADDGTTQTIYDINIDVTDVNDAPVLTPFAPTLTTVAADNHNPAGQKISAIIGTHVDDPDGFSLPRGIAITGVTTTGGSWQYSTNNGSTWTNFPSGISGNAALVLRDADFIRFLPDGTASGSETFTYRAWDQTDGSTAGSQVNIAATGGATAFSSASDTAHLTVTPDTTPPKLQSLVAADASPTDASTVHYTVTFSESVTGVNASQFSLVATGGITGASIAGVSGSGSTYTVTVNTGTGDGNLLLDVKGSGIHDLAGNAYSGAMFLPASNYTAGVAAWTVAVGDLNGDGKKDVVAANEGSTTISVLLGNGDGTLRTQTQVGAVNPLAVAIGDVNGDGKQDLLAVNWGVGNSLSVLLGNGDGTFQAKRDTVVGTQPIALATGDFNGDNKLDVVVANNGSGSLSVLLGVGDGTFTAATGSPVSMGGPLALAVADVNGDGKLDIVAGIAASQVKVLLGAGDGTFALKSSPMASDHTTDAVALGDVNGDGKLDIVTADYVTGVADVLLGNGDGTYQTRVAYAAGANVRSVAIGDVNGDGKLDLVLARDQTSGTVSILLGNGDGSFQSALTAAVGNSPKTAALADLNGDGLPDLIVANSGANTVSVLKNGGSSYTVTDLAPIVAATVTTSTVEDLPVVFSASNGNSISVSDSDNTAETVTLTVGHGTLSLARTIGLSFTAGDGSADATMTFGGALTDINAALDGMTYTPGANFQGSDSIQVVSDDGRKQASGSTSLTIDAVNDAPVGTSNTITMLEEQSHTFAVADFGFTDPNDSPANTLLAVEITTLPGAGILTDNGVAVTAGQFISVSDITGGKLVFTPAVNGSGAGYTSFTFQVQDDGGGSDADPAPKTITFDVTPVNDAPVGTSNTVTTLENAAHTFAAADFGFADPNDGPANALQAVVIATLPVAGALADDGVAVAAGQTVSVSDITGGKLVFTPAANASGSGYASFTFQVQDDGGTGNGGVDTDPAPKTITIDVTPVNDAPLGTNGTITTLEDTVYVFGTADFGFSDTGDSPANTLLAVKIATLPVVGTLMDNGVAVTAGQFIQAADIAGSLLVFTPEAGGGGSGYASFTFQVQDDGGTANGGVDVDPTPNAITVDVAAVNDAPVGMNATVTTLEDTGYVFGAADFGFSDPNDSPANALLAVEIPTLPAAGTLTDNGVAVTAGQFISVVDIAAGKLVFTPAPNGNGSGYASFTFQVQDDGGTADGGVDLDPSPKTITIDVTAVNDAPVIAGAGSVVFYTEGDAPLTLEPSITISDVDSATLVGATVSLSGFVAGDELKINGAMTGDIVNGGNTIHYSYNSSTGMLSLSGSDTVADYRAVLRLVTYDSTSLNPTDFGGARTRDIGWTVDDGSASNSHNGALDTRISISAVDSPPVAMDDSFTTDVSAAIGAGLNLFNSNGHGADGDPDDATISIAFVAGGPGAAVDAQFTLASGALLTVHADGTFAYDPNHAFDGLHLAAPSSGAANTSTTDTFTYTLADGGTATVTVTVTGVGDAFTVYSGTPGNDAIIGDVAVGHLYHLEQGGDDAVAGGSGVDGFYFGGAFDANDHVNGGGGNNDQIGLEGDYSAGVTLDGNAVTGVEVLAMLPGFDYKITTLDSFVAAGQTFTFWSVSMGAANHVTLDGSAELDGRFNFYLGQGNDIARGGAGADLFYGGNGADTLTGGAGADTFGYVQVSNSHGTTYDTITDFAAGTDRFRLGGVAVTAVDGTVNGSLSGGSFEADLTSSFGAGVPHALGAGHAVVLHVTGGSLAGHDFLIVNAHGATGYSAGNDYVFDVTGGSLAGLAPADFA